MISHNISEKRRNKRVRMPPLFLKLSSHKIDKLVPAIIMDISASGMAVLTYESYEKGEIFNIRLKIAGVGNIEIKSKVARADKKNGIFIIGMEFIEIAKEIREILNKMAHDFHNCEEKWLKNGIANCLKSCSFYTLCLRQTYI